MKSDNKEETIVTLIRLALCAILALIITVTLKYFGLT